MKQLTALVTAVTFTFLVAFASADDKSQSKFMYGELFL